MPSTTITRQKYTAASINELPAEIAENIDPNNGKGGILTGVKGFVSTVGVGGGNESSVTIRLTSSQIEWVKAEMKRTKKSRSAVLRELVPTLADQEEIKK